MRRASSMLIARRALLAAAGTLAVASIARKLWPGPGAWAAGPVAGAEAGPRTPEMHGIESMKPADPPRPPPAFSFATPDGRTRTLADYAGRGVVLNLWATWCVPCVAEMPALDGLAAKLAEAGGEAARIAILPLSSDRGGAEAVQRYYARHGLTHLPVLLDPDGAATRALAVRGIPTTLLIGADGRERGRLEGAVDWTADATLAAVRALAA